MYVMLDMEPDNTEFEIMTSMNLDDFGPGEIPYKTVLKSTTCESTAFNLKEYGYSTHALHNNDGNILYKKICISTPWI